MTDPRLTNEPRLMGWTRPQWKGAMRAVRIDELENGLTRVEWRADAIRAAWRELRGLEEEPEPETFRWPAADAFLQKLFTEAKEEANCGE